MTAHSYLALLAVASALYLPAVGTASGALAERLMAQATPPAESPASPLPSTTPPSSQPGEATPGPGMEDADTPDSHELSLGEIPIVETVELTPDLAKRALDSYIAAKEKFADSDLEQYENLQDFVDQSADGKAFEADIKAAGFAGVNDWNLAITTLGLTYGSIVDDQTPDLLLQIEEVQADTEMAQDIKDRMVKALKALIPSDTNRKVVEDLLNDPVYGPKLKLLDIEEE